MGARALHLRSMSVAHLGARASHIWGQERHTCGARGSHLWGKRVAPVGQEGRTCGARGSHLWGKRVAPVGQEGRTSAPLGARGSHLGTLGSKSVAHTTFKKVNIHILNILHSMNGSNVWGSLAAYGDALPLFKWNIYKRRIYPEISLGSPSYILRISPGYLGNIPRVHIPGIFLKYSQDIPGIFPSIFWEYSERISLGYSGKILWGYSQDIPLILPGYSWNIPRYILGKSCGDILGRSCEYPVGIYGYSENISGIFTGFSQNITGNIPRIFWEYPVGIF